MGDTNATLEVLWDLMEKNKILDLKIKGLSAENDQNTFNQSLEDCRQLSQTLLSNIKSISSSDLRFRFIQVSSSNVQKELQKITFSSTPKEKEDHFKRLLFAIDRSTASTETLINELTPKQGLNPSKMQHPPPRIPTTMSNTPLIPSSLVSPPPVQSSPQPQLPKFPAPNFPLPYSALIPVSYTHLTLPTICSV
eukprot:TRINITY_DN11115_c0_g1_i1.p1 TRINITY_DN11115_c0_g1~~TRINITY_DN11115_c0_g1_i1.p1  ORF type:complete len:202 (+),score=48.90 TRINITY_DN11115_c0_g1_i1:25-606(+)